MKKVSGGVIMTDCTDQKTMLMESLSYDLPVLRARVGLSQEELADRIGISRQTYGGIETGRREMTWTIFMALLGFYQSNEQTLNMLKHKEGFLDNVEKVL